MPDPARAGELRVVLGKQGRVDQAEEGIFVKMWADQGCRVCRRQWETAERPVFVVENIALHVELYRCSVCRNWWIMDERLAFEATDQEVTSYFGKDVLGEK